MEKVKRLTANGASLANAVRDALGNRSFTQVAIAQGVSRQNLTGALNGSRLASDSEVAAMVAELGGTVEEWRELFSDAMRQRASAAVGQ